jgi:hypothetical protein
MSNDISVFPVALLENAVTRPIAYQGEEVCGHLSDEPRRCTFPMNCLYSTCRLTLIPDGWSANLPLPDYGRVARHSPRIGSDDIGLPRPDQSLSLYGFGLGRLVATDSAGTRPIARYSENSTIGFYLRQR